MRRRPLGAAAEISGSGRAHCASVRLLGKPLHACRYLSLCSPVHIRSHRTTFGRRGESRPVEPFKALLGQALSSTHQRCTYPCRGDGGRRSRTWFGDDTGNVSARRLDGARGAAGQNHGAALGRASCDSARGQTKLGLSFIWRMQRAGPALREDRQHVAQRGGGSVSMFNRQARTCSSHAKSAVNCPSAVSRYR